MRLSGNLFFTLTRVSLPVRNRGLLLLVILRFCSYSIAFMTAPAAAMMIPRTTVIIPSVWAFHFHCRSFGYVYDHS